CLARYPGSPISSTAATRSARVRSARCAGGFPRRAGRSCSWPGARATLWPGTASRERSGLPGDPALRVEGESVMAAGSPTRCRWWGGEQDRVHPVEHSAVSGQQVPHVLDPEITLEQRLGEVVAGG